MQALRNEPITIYGDGTQTRSFCYVSDLIDGIWRLMNTEDLPTPLNIGNPADHAGISVDQHGTAGHRCRDLHRDFGRAFRRLHIAEIYERSILLLDRSEKQPASETADSISVDEPAD